MERRQSPVIGWETEPSGPHGGQLRDRIGRLSGELCGNSGLVAGAATSVKFGGDVTLGDGDTATNLAGAVTLDGLNWSGYDGLTTGALTLSTAAVDINSQGGNIQLQALQEEVRTLALNAGVAVERRQSPVMYCVGRRNRSGPHGGQLRDRIESTWERWKQWFGKRRPA